MNSLFSLIHSLTPTEKRYFKLFAQRQVQHKNTNYAKIFDAINEQIEYNEESLLKKFKRENFINQFGVTKNYLFNIILSCMQQYNEENFIEWKIRNMFLQCKILASKGLDEDAEKMIRKTKELAWQYELYYVIGDLIILEKYLFGNFRIGEPTIESYMSIEKEEQQAFEISNTHQQIGNVWHYLTLLELEIGILPQSDIKQRADIYTNAIYMTQEPLVSYNAKYRYYATWSLYYNLVNDQERNYECCKKGVLIREEQIQQQPLLNLDPLAPYYNFLISCEKANLWDEFEFYLNKIYNYEAPTIEINIRRMHNYCWCGLMFFLHQKEYEKAYEILQKYKAFFIEKKINFRKDFKIYIEACCAIVCIFLKKNNEAIKWLNNILNNPIPQVELRSQASARLYSIMLHFDEQNFETIEYVSKQAKKYLEQISLYHEPEKLFLKHINEAVNEPDKKKQNQILHSLFNQLNKCTLSISGNAVNKFILNWLANKLN
ncbi:MAG: hypothetical protein ACOVMI_02895 [Chitinophagaceae bacterium]